MTEIRLGSENRPITIQSTSKKIKFIILTGWLLFIIGLLLFVPAANANFVAMAGWPMGIGAGLVLFGKFMRWWKHA